MTWERTTRCHETGLPASLRTLDPPRELRPDERKIIDQLLAEPFLGRDEIRSQLTMSKVAAYRVDGQDIEVADVASLQTITVNETLIVR